MAVLAHVSRRNMIRCLTRCLHAVMATAAVANDTHMIKVGRNPAATGVAVVAGVAAGNVIRILTGGSDAVMAG